MVPTVTSLHGDAIEQLRTLPDESVHTCITSPPYWALRDYKMPGQIGLERTPEEYVARIVAVFAEVRRVLRDDGTLWVNIGDSYNAWNANRSKSKGYNLSNLEAQPKLPGGYGLTAPNLKPKDMVGIPWMVAFTLRADGWYLRSEIIWHKPNPMPESICDRPTKAHEQIFLLSKRETYYYDADAIKEPCSEDTHARYARDRSNNHKNADGGPGNQTMAKSMKHMLRPRGVTPKAEAADENTRAKASWMESMSGPVEMRNKRSVWTVTLDGYSEAHFATYPPSLIRPCVLAGCPVGGTVLDPFGGSGTTGMVAIEEGRNAILIDINPEYVEMQKRRCHVTPGLGI